METADRPAVHGFQGEAAKRNACRTGISPRVSRRAATKRFGHETKETMKASCTVCMQNNVDGHNDLPRLSCASLSEVEMRGIDAGTKLGGDGSGVLLISAGAPRGTMAVSALVSWSCKQGRGGLGHLA